MEYKESMFFATVSLHTSNNSTFMLVGMSQYANCSFHCCKNDVYRLSIGDIMSGSYGGGSLGIIRINRALV